MKSLHTLLIILVANVTMAQNYNPMPFGNARWMETEYSMLGPIFDHSYCYFSNDTTTYSFFGHPYHQIELISDSIYNLTKKIGSEYIFDDTAHRKVYLKSSTERLLYDFSKNIGDTIFNVYCHQFNDIALIVDSIKTVSYHGINRRVFYLSDTNAFYTYATTWIEGIGSPFGLYRNTFNCKPSDPEWALNCVFKDGNQLFGNSCDFKVVGTDDVDITTFIKIPNPIINNQIDIYNLYPFPLKWTLYSMEGQIIQQGSQLSIPVTHCSSGMYFLRIETEFGHGVFKIVK